MPWLSVLAAGCCIALADPAAPPAKTPVKPADNSYCYVCHANFKTEKLAQNHATHGVGCATCHGESDRHSADEDGLTAPDIMYAKDRIQAACTKCHAETKLRTLDEHELAFAKDAAKHKGCTECHGEHRMAVRTRHWDKTTGKLLSAEGVRMMEKNSAATSAR